MTSSPTSPTLNTYSGTARFLPITTGAFGVSVGIWTLWFSTHLPWLGLPEMISLPIILLWWFVSTAYFAGHTFGGKIVPSTLLGLTTATIGLLLVGSKLVEAPAGGENLAGALKPNAPLIAIGYLALGSLIGTFAGLASRVLPGASCKRGFHPLETSATDRDWLARFALVTVAAIFPLLLIGGLVTSTNSGMAVVDWPGTFGSNMFLYPLGPRAAPDVYLEHSHRLFGTFVGLSVITLLVLTCLHESRRWVRGWALAILGLVILQGVIGGLRVRQGNPIHELDDRHMRLIHGVLAQIFLAATVCLAAFISRTARTGDGRALAMQGSAGRRVRLFATAAMHATIIQLLFGAMYRHLRDRPGGGHALMTHMAFSFVVLILATLAASSTKGLPDAEGNVLARSLRRCGSGVHQVVGLQFALGWVAWGWGGKGYDPEIWQALLRTAHQANGALLLALLTWTAMLARGIPKRATP